MEFYSWNVENAIYMKDFQVLAINNLISQETGGLKILIQNKKLILFKSGCFSILELIKRSILGFASLLL